MRVSLIFILASLLFITFMQASVGFAHSTETHDAASGEATSQNQTSDAVNSGAKKANDSASNADLESSGSGNVWDLTNQNVQADSLDVTITLFDVPIDAWIYSGIFLTIILGSFFLVRFAPFSKWSQKAAPRGLKRGLVGATSLAFLWTIGVAGWGLYAEQQVNAKPEPMELTHIHGLGFSDDGARLIVPAHHGLVAFERGAWREVAGEKHDYMGFAVVKDGFYSSGHPAPGSDLKEPLGWVRSNSFEGPLEILSAHGESDFHFSTVGYESKISYVLNLVPTSTMSAAGLFRSEDGKAWTELSVEGVEGAPVALAAHPKEAYGMVFATESGLYKYEIAKQRFTPFAETLLKNGTKVTAVAYTPRGELLITLQNANGQAEIYNWNEQSKRGLKLFVPPNILEPIVYVAGNPVDPNVIAIATKDRDVYLTADRAENWIKIVSKGKGN